MKETKIINLFGGPGVGKSVMAAQIFYEMKKRGLSVELVTEYAKDLVWEKRDGALADQIYVFAKQQRKMNIVTGQVDYLICDSPILLSLLYKQEHLPDAFSDLVCWKHQELPSFNFVIKRSEVVYQQEGRREDRGKAKKLDERIQVLLKNLKVNFQNVGTEEWRVVLEKIENT